VLSYQKSSLTDLTVNLNTQMNSLSELKLCLLLHGMFVGDSSLFISNL
jgi:hypothetical protein